MAKNDWSQSRMFVGGNQSNSNLTMKMVFKTKHSINFDLTMLHALHPKTFFLFFESTNISSDLPK